MNKPQSKFLLLRGPTTDDNGNEIPIIAQNVSMVRASETDLTGYSFLKSWETFEEWVPTKELHLYQKAKK